MELITDLVKLYGDKLGLEFVDLAVVCVSLNLKLGHYESKI